MARNAHTSVLLRQLMRLMLPPHFLQEDERRVQKFHGFDKWVDSWSRCVQNKPNLDFMGFVGLTDDEFQFK